MKKTLTFDTQKDREGAELIIDSVIEDWINEGKIVSYGKKQSGVIVEYENVPEEVFKEAEQRPMWALMEFTRELPVLLNLALTAEDKVNAADDQLTTIRGIQDELFRLSQIGRE